MSHYHLEVVMPPTEDVPAAIKAILDPFSENGEGEDYDAAHSFWDFWVIGGRFAGSKLEARCDPEKLGQFNAWLQAEKVTVSGFIAGKQEISPASQIPKIDAKWNEMFPGPKFIKCPLFNHSNDQYADGLKGTIEGDICHLGDVPDRLTCARIIFAAPGFHYHSKQWIDPLEACFMLSRTNWNGLNHEDSAWNGTFKAALDLFEKDKQGSSEEYRKAHLPMPEWLVVTVDYHS